MEGDLLICAIVGLVIGSIVAHALLEWRDEAKSRRVDRGM